MRWLSELDERTIHEFIGATGDAAPRVTLVAISSIDGRGAVAGKSGGLGNEADLRLLKTLRDTADVVLAGSATVQTEGYCGVGRDRATRRFGSAGDRPIPPIAVLTRRFELDPESRFFTDVATPPIVIGPAAAAATGSALVEAGSEIMALPDTDAASVVAALSNRGFARIVIEGGPSVYREFLAAGVVDEIFMTVAPTWLGSGPLTLGPANDPAAPPAMLDFTLEAVAHSDSHVFLRYSRGRAG
ncbi:MAG TPA: pyrimidine reductase family protein [Actinomycetales bacterium]|nr:pyrimidine reductase family protein [Actinomycetales bacterium]